MAGNLLPILLLLAVIAVVLARLPKVELGHSARFRWRRGFNWFPVGMLYALLYMGRYNLTVAKGTFENMCGPDGLPVMTNADFGTIFGIGTAIYGAAFLINGPLTDRLGGRRALLLGGAGTIVANAAMGIVTWTKPDVDLRSALTVLYGLNMYFQSFGAAAIVKVNSSWFHVRERGVFGAIFGILISLGIYFAFDVSAAVLKTFGLEWVFLVPALALVVVWIAVFVVAKDTPGEAGHVDFDTADASSGEDGVRVPVREVFRRMLRNPVIRLIALIEFCSGFLRQAIMQWYRTFAKATGQTDNAIYENWGLLLCCAGILGGVFAGTISDHLFKSRRGPVAAVLYGLMLAGAFGLFLIVSRSWGPIGTAAFEGYAFAVGGLVVFMSMCIIGVHGMLSGTASMDFGGRNNVGVAVGIIDGFVYAGTAVMAVTYGSLLPDVEFQSASQCVVGSPTKVQIIAQPVTDWLAWPLLMIPVAALGLWLARKIWHATPQSQAKK